MDCLSKKTPYLEWWLFVHGCESPSSSLRYVDKNSTLLTWDTCVAVSIRPSRPIAETFGYHQPLAARFCSYWVSSHRGWILLCWLYSRLKCLAFLAIFITSGTLFQPFTALTEKKFSLSSSLTLGFTTFISPAACLVLTGPSPALLNQLSL